ncbi:receptor-like protein EIX2 [Gossypium hirsutum]|uniref:Receptor-like protein EIX2 n=1 Tax=Gossypium hirsutum TaxID=3635 RepID=A0ABM3AZW2_GOSHI|nr:receptor-like protein EIX2 [Gossypium hirsutum]
MEVLYIDKNLISGDIPDCWNHWQGLNLLNLGSNNLTVKIPPSLWHLNLTILNLRNNTMFGEFPSTMQNFLDLIMIDLSENHFSRSVPAWIGDKLSNLVILSLRSNNFDGHIPHKICDLQFLQNLDLAHNNISGVIPKCFNNLSAMATTIKINNFVLAKYVDAGLVFLNALLVLKGREDEYWSSLGLVTSMDISANSLTGEIPKEIGSLVGLLSLNFSGNLLTGNIPDNIGNMELMESLDDLSMNQLNGEIPQSFSNLNFLNHFNVSYNNLTGQIPTSTQLQSFENLSYVGNHLCRPPLTKNCTSKGIPIDVANNGSSREGSKVNWLYVSIVLGFVMGFWGVVAPLFFIRSWRLAYYRKLDHVGRKLYVSWATMDM